MNVVLTNNGQEKFKDIKGVVRMSKSKKVVLYKPGYNKHNNGRFILTKIIAFFIITLYVRVGILLTCGGPVSDLRQIVGFLRVPWFSPPIKLTAHDITEIFLKVTLNTITLTLLTCGMHHFTKRGGLDP
jgi:hypothetical protein